MKALIIGAGIGGLTCALQMHKAGIDVEVFESVNTLKPLGVGINIQPHAIKVLAQLGLLEQLRKIGVVTSRLSYTTKDGKLILTEPRGLQAGYDYPQLSIHRGKLQMLLLQIFNERVGVNKLHLSHQFTCFEQNETAVIAHFTDRKNDKIDVKYSADLLIGADGINSIVRTQLHPNEKPLHFEGIRMWRGTTYHKPLFNGSTVLVAGHPAVQLIIYPISQCDQQGQALINWVVEILDPSATVLNEDHWNSQGSVDDFLHYFSDWQLDFLDHKSLFNCADRILEYPMVDRDPLPFWSQGHVTLLGDAAHPMYPRGGNGASQAIIDTSELIECLKSKTTIEIALKEYEKNRLSVTATIVENNRNQNQTAIFKLIEAHCDGRCGKVHRCIDSHTLKKLVADYKQQAGFSVQQVNEQA